MMNKMIRYSTCLVLLLCLASMLACSSEAESVPDLNQDQTDVLIFGGGNHHNFDRWFNKEDSTIIATTGASVTYTEDPVVVASQLNSIDILVMNTNQSIDHNAYPDAIIEFVEEGNGLVLIHASTWFIWDWPEYFSALIGGGSNSHGPLGEFDVYVNDADHPVMQGVPDRFSITDELYRFQRDEDGTDMHVLATGIEPDTGAKYPVVWATEHGNGNIINITLGHDGDAHQHEAFIAVLENSIEWLQE